MSVRTEVCITIDTEFSIGGAFADPVRRRPIGEENVTCPADGHENGLGFLLDTFRDHGIAATFFTETLQSAYFGDAPMGRMVERILRAGQDVQLHLHPCWRSFRDPDWRETIRHAPPNDRCDGRGDAEMQDIIADGIAGLRRIGAPAPAALRTGNLRADRATYRAMEACGLPVASNIGAALFRPADPALQLAGGRHRVGQVLEVPVLTYTQLEVGSRRLARLFTTTATSLGETVALLRQARREEVPTVVLLTHPFEFIKGDRLDSGRQHANRINKRRLERMCAFIAGHPDEFAAVSFGQAAPGWLAAPDVPAPALRAPLWPVLSRMVQNRANDIVPAL